MSPWVLCDNHLFFSNLFVSSLLNWGGLPTASKWYGPITYHIQRRWSAPITDHVNSFYVENLYIWFGFELTYCGDNLGCPYDAIDDDFDQYDQHANFITFIQIYQFMDYEKEKWYFYCGCLPSLGIPTPLKRIQGTNQSSGSRLCVSTPRAWRRSLPWNEKQVSNFFSQILVFCSSTLHS